MRKLLLILCLMVLLSATAMANPMQYGVGFFGGLNLPIVQDDQGSGTAFGFKGILKPAPFVEIEPNVTFGKFGDPGTVSAKGADEDVDIDMGLVGSKINSFGVDFLLGTLPSGPLFRFYVHLGFASFSIKNDDTDYDNSKFGMSGGLGLGFGLNEKVSLDFRSKLVVAPQEDGSKKALYILGGLNYFFK